MSANISASSFQETGKNANCYNKQEITKTHLIQNIWS